MSSRARYRFSVRQLLFLTTALAVLFAGLTLAQIPNWMRAGFGVYAMLILAREVIRWPAKRAKLHDYRRRRKEVILRREELAEEVEQLRKQIATSTSDPLHGQNSDVKNTS